MAVSCSYVIFLNFRNHIFFLSNAPHIIKIKILGNEKTLFRAPSRMKLAKNPLFYHFSNLQDFVICFDLYESFLASEND